MIILLSKYEQGDRYEVETMGVVSTNSHRGLSLDLLSSYIPCGIT